MEKTRYLTSAAILAALLILAGCGAGDNNIVMECTPPLIYSGDGCCLDADQNGVCDSEEKEERTEEIDKETDGNIEKETEEQPEESPEEDVGEDIEDTAQEGEEEWPDTEEQRLEKAEQTAELFTTSWDNKQYNMMYKMFTPRLKDKKTAKEFTAIMELDPFYKKIEAVELGGVRLTGEDTADITITAKTNVQDIEIPGTTAESIDGEWKIRAFADVFDLDAFDAACSGYRYNNQYKTSDCALDFAKKTEDPSYCELTECHYVECLKALGEPAGIRAEAQQCYKCQPVMKTTNECILDIAIKYDSIGACDVIPEDKYSDKYCACYGGFANHKGTSGYCNMVQDPDHKKLCLKGYEGKYC